MNQLPKVSVCMITYGHEKFIREAIEGVLMQKIDFNIELVLANDCSPDKTDTVVQNILKTHPKASIINYIRHEQNIGMMPNFMFALQECKGKYIALCEGDDYWTNPLKLQKQIDFLETNPEYVLSFHNSNVIDTRNSSDYLFVEKYDSSECAVEAIFETWLIPTASMVFRNGFETDFPVFFTQGTHGDLGLQVYLSKFGKFSVIDEVMSVYRINESSVSVNMFSGLQHNNNHIKQLRLMNSYFEKKYEPQIYKRIFLFYLINANFYKNKNFVKPIYWISKGIVLKPSLIYFYRKDIVLALKNVFLTIGYFFKKSVTVFKQLLLK